MPCTPITFTSIWRAITSTAPGRARDGWLGRLVFGLAAAQAAALQARGQAGGSLAPEAQVDLRQRVHLATIQLPALLAEVADGLERRPGETAAQLDVCEQATDE